MVKPRIPPCLCPQHVGVAKTLKLWPYIGTPCCLFIYLSVCSLVCAYWQLILYYARSTVHDSRLTLTRGPLFWIADVLTKWTIYSDDQILRNLHLLRACQTFASFTVIKFISNVFSASINVHYLHVCLKNINANNFIIKRSFDKKWTHLL